MNRETFTSIYKKALWALFALGIVIAPAYLIALLTDFEYSIHHFESGSVWFWIFTVAAFAAAAISAVLALLANRSVAIAKIPAPTPAALFAAIFGAVMCMGTFFTELNVSPAAIISPMEKVGGILSVFIALTLVLACLKKYRGSAFHRISAVLAVLSINATMFSCYFDFSEPLNGPARNITTIVQAAVLLLLISELRLLFGIAGKKITSILYVFSTCSAAALGFGFSLGGILYRIFANNPADPNPSLFRLGVYLAISIFAADRALRLPAISADPVKENPATTKK